MQNWTAYVWGLISKFGPQTLYLLTTMVLARYLSAEDFGMIGVLSVIFTVATVLLDSGLGGSLIKERNITDIDCSSITCFNVFVSIIIYILLFLFADRIECIYNIPKLSNVIKTLGLIFPINAIGIVPKSLLLRNVKFKTICWSYMLGVVVGCISSIIVAINDGKVYSLVIYQLVTSMVNVIVNCVYSKYIPKFKFSFKSLKRLLPFGIFTSIISIIDTIYENILTAMIGKFMNVNQAGYMYQAKRVEETLSTSLANTIGVVTFPILTKLKDNHEAFNKEALSTIKIISCLSFPLLFTVAIFADQIIVLLFGDKWIESGFYLETLIFAGAFLILETLIRNFIKALCEVKKLMYITILKRLLGIAILIGALLIKYEYIVYGYIISSILGYVLNSYLYIKLAKVNIMKLLFISFGSFILCLIYYAVFKCMLLMNMSIIIDIPLSLLSLFIYYISIMPKIGINILSLVKFRKK